MINDNVNMWQ